MARIALVLALAALTGCGPTTCRQVVVAIYRHPRLPIPAGQVVLMCDGQTVAQATAPTVTVGGF